MDVTHERDVQWYTNGSGIHLYTVLCWWSIIHLLLAIVVGIYIHIYLCILSKQYCSIIYTVSVQTLLVWSTVCKVYTPAAFQLSSYLHTALHCSPTPSTTAKLRTVYSTAALTSHTHPMLYINCFLGITGKTVFAVASKPRSDAVHGATNGASGCGTILVQNCSFNVAFSVIPSDHLQIQNEATTLTTSGYVWAGMDEKYINETIVAGRGWVDMYLSNYLYCQIAEMFPKNV